ncbi:hypothetical protein TB2_016909 [Malus domestica]
MEKKNKTEVNGFKPKKGSVFPGKRKLVKKMVLDSMAEWVSSVSFPADCLPPPSSAANITKQSNSKGSKQRHRATSKKPSPALLLETTKLIDSLVHNRLVRNQSDHKAMAMKEEKNPSKGLVAAPGNKKTCFCKPKIPNYASVIPAKRRSVKRMMFDSMLKSPASFFYRWSSSSSQDSKSNNKTTSLIFPDQS